MFRSRALIRSLGHSLIHPPTHSLTLDPNPVKHLGVGFSPRWRGPVTSQMPAETVLQVFTAIVGTGDRALWDYQLFLPSVHQWAHHRGRSRGSFGRRISGFVSFLVTPIGDGDFYLAISASDVATISVAFVAPRLPVFSLPHESRWCFISMTDTK